MSENQDYIILNSNIEASECCADPLILSKKLISLLLNLKGENYINEKLIDYENLIKSQLYHNDLKNLSGMLKKVSLDALVQNSEEQINDKNILVFFINIYNSLTIHSICYLFENKMVSDSNVLNLLEGKFWSRMAYQIGNYNFSLDDIEHGILRSNRAHPSKTTCFFSNDDSRLKYCVKNFDPRIHFALNCGAKGCPPIAVYRFDNLERGLQLACEAFCTNETEIFPDEGKVVVSRLFLWYGTDFVINPNEEIFDYVSSRFKPDDQNKEKLNQLRSSSKKISIEFSAYNWDLNIKA